MKLRNKVPKLPFVENLMENILKGIHSNQEISSHQEDVWAHAKGERYQL